MKRNILVSALILGLFSLVGLSFQIGWPAVAHSSETIYLTFKATVGEEPHTEEEMDPDMPGMDHSDPSVIDEGVNHSDSDMPGMDHSDPSVIDEGVDRPLKETLGAFGVATSIVLSGALILKRRDETQRELKEKARKNYGEVR